MREVEFARNPGREEGDNVDLAMHALDAVPGANALTNDPFHEGRLRMLRREEIIYLSSHILRDAQRQEPSFEGGRRKSDAEIAEENERLLQRQDHEAQLFRSLLDACAAMKMTTSRHAVALASGAGEEPQADHLEPDCLSPGELEKYLTAYTNFVLLGGRLQENADSSQPGSSTTSSFVIDTHYGPAGDTGSAEVDPTGDPAWIHVNVPDTYPFSSQEPMFPHRREREGRLSRRVRAKDKEENIKNPQPRTLGQSLGVFMVKLLRLIILGGLIGLGYLILTRRGPI